MLVQEIIMKDDVKAAGDKWEYSVTHARIIHVGKPGSKPLSFNESSRRVMEARLHNDYVPSPALVLWLFDHRQASTLRQVNLYLGNTYVKGILSKNSQADK